MKNVLKVLLCSAALLGMQAQAAATELVCELGQRMGVRGDQALDNSIELICQGQRYNLQRVATSTGASPLRNERNSALRAMGGMPPCRHATLYPCSPR